MGKKRTIGSLTIVDVVYRVHYNNVVPESIKSLSKTEIKIGYDTFTMTKEDYTRFNFDIKDTRYFLEKIDALKALRLSFESRLDANQKKQDDLRNDAKDLIQFIRDNDLRIAKELGNE